ncbi:MAG: hypothetical protein ACFFCV_03495 [Promethearchaeota archaeon]
MNIKEILITTPVVAFIIGGYCTLFTYIFLSLTNPTYCLTLATILTGILGPICLIIVSKVIKKNPPLVASDRRLVGISPLDYFTWGHIAFGVFSFIVELFFVVFLSLEQGLLLWWDVMLAIILIAITWDLIENTLFIGIGIKFENRRDSVSNIFSDVFFVSLSGLLMIIVFLITQKNFTITLIIGIITLVACGIIFYIRHRQVGPKREEFMKTR